MYKVEKVLLVTPLWDFPVQGEGDFRVHLCLALEKLGLVPILAGPRVGSSSPVESPGPQVITIDCDRRRRSDSPILSRWCRDRLAPLLTRTQADLVHYLDLRLAAMGLPGEIPATGWLGDRTGSQAPLLPNPFSGGGWFWRWQDGRRARAMQISALARLAGLAVPDEETGRAAAKAQRRGMPVTHIFPPAEENPGAHAVGLQRLWQDLPI